MAKFLLPVICVLLAMLLLEFISNTNIQVSPSKWGGIPHIVVTKLYFQLARIQLITKSALSTAQTKSRSRATKSPFTGHTKIPHYGLYLQQSSSNNLYSLGTLNMLRGHPPRLPHITVITHNQIHVHLLEIPCTLITVIQ